jgi:hypothetical protein
MNVLGYKSYDKNLSGVIHITDGGGTDIQNGNITCKTLTVGGTDYTSYNNNLQTQINTLQSTDISLQTQINLPTKDQSKRMYLNIYHRLNCCVLSQHA